MKYLFTLNIIIIIFFISCSSGSTDNENSIQSKPNIMLIIADDMGLDASPGYNIGSI